MTITLIRHAEAVHPSVDPARPLSPAGRSQAERTARQLKECGASASRFIHSGKTRAMETAEIVRQAINGEGELVQMDQLSPNDATDAIYFFLNDCEDDVMIFSHLPFLPKLTSRLMTGDEDSSHLAFVPAAAVMLEREEGGKWKIIDCIKP